MSKRIVIDAKAKEVMQILKRLKEKYGGDTKLAEVIKSEYDKDDVSLC